MREDQHAAGFGPPTDRTATVSATLEQRHAHHGAQLVFTSVEAQGDPQLVASANSLRGQTFTLAGQTGKSTLSGISVPNTGSYDDGGGILNPADAALEFQLLVPSQQTPHPTRPGHGRSLQMASVDTGASPHPLMADDAITSTVTVRGISAQNVTTTVRAARQLPVVAAYARLGNATYAADPTFEAVFSAPASVPVPTTTKTVTTPGGTYSDTLPGIAGVFQGVFGALGCALSLGLACGSVGSYYVPPSTSTVTTPVPGPANLATTLGGSIDLTSSELIAQHGHTLLSASGTGEMKLSGSLPSGSDVPAAVAGKTASVVTDVTYSSRLVSPWPGPSRTTPGLAVKLAGLLALLLVGAAAVALGAWTTSRRRVTSPR